MPALNTYRVFQHIARKREMRNTRIHFIPCSVPFKASTSGDVVIFGLGTGADTGGTIKYKERGHALINAMISRQFSSAAPGLEVHGVMPHIAVGFGRYIESVRSRAS